MSDLSDVVFCFFVATLMTDETVVDFACCVSDPTPLRSSVSFQPYLQRVRRLA